MFLWIFLYIKLQVFKYERDKIRKLDTKNVTLDIKKPARIPGNFHTILYCIIHYLKNQTWNLRISMKHLSEWYFMNLQRFASVVCEIVPNWPINTFCHTGEKIKCLPVKLQILHYLGTKGNSHIYLIYPWALSCAGLRLDTI